MEQSKAIGILDSYRRLRLKIRPFFFKSDRKALCRSVVFTCR